MYPSEVSHIRERLNFNVYDPPVDQSAVNLHDALALHLAGRFAEAEAIYRQAILLDAQHAPALHLLGVVLHQMGRSNQGVHCIQRAIQIQPNVPSFHNNLGEALRELDRCQEAVDSYLRALTLRPDYPEALNNLGGEYGRLARMDESIACLRRCVALQPDDADAHWNLSVALLLTGQWDQGWNEFEWRLRRPESPGRVYPQPYWAGQSLAGKTLLLWGEQGLGDMLQFFRYVPLARQSGARVIVDLHAPLVSLLQSQNIADGVYSGEEQLPHFDFHAPLMSMPLLMRSTLQSLPRQVPYLWASEQSRQYWNNRLPKDGTRKIGIAWAGRPEHRNDRRRSIPPELLKPLAAIPGITFVTVQPRPPGANIPAGLPLLDFGIQLKDFADTAGLISQLDLLITVDTSVAHLAGAMGLPVWLLVPFSPDWRWLLQREDSPWYPTMKLFRQPTLGNWPDVLIRVVERLSQLG